ncbi:MAG: 2-hydroxychromene-2-carboxylate isomerase [Rhodopila sp.]|jgi:2-hydroxychromene-2-carboxylate isomerase
MAELECFFDCSSPWTYFAFESLLRMQEEIDVTIQWRPFLVGGVFNAVNPSIYSARDQPVPAKAAYAKKDQQDWARYLGLPTLYRPTVFPVNSVKAMRACIVLEPEDKLVRFAREAFKSYWIDDQDISQIAVLTDICGKLDIDAEKLLAAIDQQPVKDSLRANTEEAIDRGSFGSPTIFVGGDDMYFGNDRMPLVRDAVLRRRQ